MRWRRRRGGGDVIDRRGMGGGGIAIGGGSIVGLIVVLLFMFLGGGDGTGIPDPLDPFDPVPDSTATRDPDAPDPQARLVDFVEFVVGDVQDLWTRTFDRNGRGYRRAALVLFTDGTSSGCGGATSEIGPHYCPADQRIYLDLGFFRELSSRFGAPGDFAQAYVIAHEVGHHVQNLLGIDDEVRGAQQEDPDRANELSVRMELQADCLAGVWGHSAAQRKLLEAGDVQEGLEAAAAVGDDRLQREGGGRVDRETWTHGSSAQRVKWFRTGFDTGDPAACDTFSGGI
jgi:predicted metalloprotease